MRSQAVLKTENKTPELSASRFDREVEALPKLGANSSPELKCGADHHFSRISVFNDNKHTRAPIRIQPKLMINQPGDKYEQEADTMAERVMRMPERPTQYITPKIQRKCARCEQEDGQMERPSLMRKTIGSGDFAATPHLVSQLTSTQGGGNPLPDATKDFMENAFGADFSKVRIHRDEVAVEMNRGIRARAFTLGSNIYFNQGEYTPESRVGKRLLAHELEHVLQQGDRKAYKGSKNYLHGGSERKTSLGGANEPVVQHSSLPSFLQRQEVSTSAPPVSLEVADLPATNYVDLFEEVHYDLSYRSQGGNSSKWVQVQYRDGTVIDLNIDDIIDESMDPRTALEMMANGRVGEGGRIFPAAMNSATIPRLAAAKQEAIRIMEEYNFQFMLATLPAVIFIITMGVGMGARPTRTTVRRLPSRSTSPPPSTAGETATPPQRPLTRSTSPVPTTGRPGDQGASVRSAGERAAQRPPASPLAIPQQVIRDTLIREHPGLHPNVATEAARGGSRAMGPGGAGADVILINGGGREVSVHSGAFTSQGIGSHLQAEALQRGTTEIYLQINSGSRQGLLQMISDLRTGYPELRNIFVKIFGSNGEVWWNGIFRGPS